MCLWVQYWVGFTQCLTVRDGWLVTTKPSQTQSKQPLFACQIGTSLRCGRWVCSRVPHSHKHHSPTHTHTHCVNIGLHTQSHTHTHTHIYSYLHHSLFSIPRSSLTSTQP